MCVRWPGRSDLVQLASRFHGPAERADELVGPSGSVRAALLLDRRSFVVGDSVVVEAVVCNQTDTTVQCAAVLQQVRCVASLYFSRTHGCLPIRGHLAASHVTV